MSIRNLGEIKKLECSMDGKRAVLHGKIPTFIYGNGTGRPSHIV
jgi:hypothetical protein